MDRKLPEDFEIDVHNLPITEGKVHFIRQAKGDRTISVLNEDFDVDESLAYSNSRPLLAPSSKMPYDYTTSRYRFVV